MSLRADGESDGWRGCADLLQVADGAVAPPGPAGTVSLRVGRAEASFCAITGRLACVVLPFEAEAGERYLGECLIEPASMPWTGDPSPVDGSSFDIVVRTPDEWAPVFRAARAQADWREAGALQPAALCILALERAVAVAELVIGRAELVAPFGVELAWDDVSAAIVPGQLIGDEAGPDEQRRIGTAIDRLRTALAGIDAGGRGRSEGEALLGRLEAELAARRSTGPASSSALSLRRPGPDVDLIERLPAQGRRPASGLLAGNGARGGLHAGGGGAPVDAGGVFSVPRPLAAALGGGDLRGTVSHREARGAHLVTIDAARLADPSVQWWAIALDEAGSLTGGGSLDLRPDGGLDGWVLGAKRIGWLQLTPSPFDMTGRAERAADAERWARLGEQARVVDDVVTAESAFGLATLGYLGIGELLLAAWSARFADSGHLAAELGRVDTPIDLAALLRSMRRFVVAPFDEDDGPVWTLFADLSALLVDT
jgi:hypothetical protein